MLELTPAVHAQLLGYALDELPLEACGLLVGTPGDADGPAGPARATVFHPTANLAASAKVYTVDPRAHLRAEREADDAGLQVLGVFHSHTHTDPYPSPTDVAQAPDPTWHYLIVSLRHGAPSLRSYRIVDGNIEEESVVVVDR